VCCVCAYNEEGDTFEICSENEKDIIKAVFDNFFDLRSYITTWDGNRFDIPFLYKRAIILGVATKTAMNMWVKRYATTPHCDLAKVWTNWSNDYLSLENASSAIMGEHKIDLDYKLFPILMKTQEGRSKLTEYCMMDCKLTKTIYDKCNHVLF
jgi:DNA polymerase elongation subunit (family B)